MPPGSTTLGPKQVANQFKSTPVITQQVTLFDQGDSSVDYGNLLSLPVANGFLYVEPLYVKSSGASQPILERVIVYYSNSATGGGNQIGYGDTLAHALTNLTQVSIGLGISAGHERVADYPDDAAQFLVADEYSSPDLDAGADYGGADDNAGDALDRAADPGPARRGVQATGRGLQDRQSAQDRPGAGRPEEVRPTCI